MPLDLQWCYRVEQLEELETCFPASCLLPELNDLQNGVNTNIHNMHKAEAGFAQSPTVHVTTVRKLCFLF